MFYCGFSGEFCGQSSINDVNDKASIVLLAFANILSNGSILVDAQNFPNSLITQWKSSGKKVMISVGGYHGIWRHAFTSQQNTNNFVNSIYQCLITYNLDGIDLNIESYQATPRQVANMIIQLKKLIGYQRLLIVSP